MQNILCRLFLLLFAGLVSAHTPAFARSVTVAGINGVGYTQIPMYRGCLHLVSLPFDPISGGYGIENLLSGARCGLPAGSKIYRWNAAAQTYHTSAETLVNMSGLRWLPGTNVLERGQAFWIQIPSEAAQPTYTLNLFGKIIPVTNDISALPAGFSMVGFPYPVDYPLTNTTLSTASGGGDKLYAYDPTNDPHWRMFTWVNIPAPPHWTPDTFVFPFGGGVFLIRSTATNWSQPRPYSW